jgi:hypothetical protein
MTTLWAADLLQAPLSQLSNKKTATRAFLLLLLSKNVNQAEFLKSKANNNQLKINKTRPSQTQDFVYRHSTTKRGVHLWPLFLDNWMRELRSLVIVIKNVEGLDQKDAKPVTPAHVLKVQAIIPVLTGAIDRFLYWVTHDASGPVASASPGSNMLNRVS